MAFFSLPPFSHFFFALLFWNITRVQNNNNFSLFFFVIVKWSNNDKLYRALVTKRYSQHNESIFYKWQSVAAKKISPSPTPKLLPKKTTAIYNMTNEIKEKEKIMMKWKMIKRKTRNRKKLHPLLLSKKKCFSSTEHTFSQDVWKLCFKQYIMNWNKHRQKALILNCFLFSI